MNCYVLEFELFVALEYAMDAAARTKSKDLHAPDVLASPEEKTVN